MKAGKAAEEFLRLESAGGIILAIAALAAIIVANTPLYGSYHHILNEVYFRVGFSHEGGFDLELKKSILHWINDGMMAVFFFLIGLEIKREFSAGELSSKERALLPFLGAMGGIAVPALLYRHVNAGADGLMSGWAIPAATDIAFALGVLSVLGSRIPSSLKVLLTAVAVIDDLAAILIIALFYTDNIVITPLYFAGAALAGLFVLNRKGVGTIAPYILLGFILWAAVLESGIHATIAGVFSAFFIPMKDKKSECPCMKLEHALHPWVAYGILPLFAFANAGLPLSNMSWENMMHPLTLGIAAGLFIGKQAGIFFMLWLAVTLRLCPRPQGAGWVQIYGVSALCGIGFTMSLFIGGLAFDSEHAQNLVRAGVIAGSLASALLGYAVLRFAPAARHS
ncbi:MAG: Na+/H+ antiporter NhaA [Proteobacteria bacterium]|nr:Na+/H+ antiporter NhaA [Pseudomonadota bacterium]